MERKKGCILRSICRILPPSTRGQETPSPWGRLGYAPTPAYSFCSAAMMIFSACVMGRE